MSNKNFISRTDKRDSAAEKAQLTIVKDSCSTIAKDFNFGVNFCDFDTHKKGHRFYMTHRGIIAERSDAGRKYNKFYDSKIFDSVVHLNTKDNDYNLYFFCKWNENSGGHQDNIYKEICGLMNGIKKHKNPNSVFVFLIDGAKWNNETFNDLNAPDNCIFCTSETIKDSILSFIE